MYNSIINNFSDWKSLPWNKINEKIFLLQKKIYKASEECDQKKVYKIQNYLINCSEVKLIAIEYVCKSIINYYINYNKERYYINDKEKESIFNYLLKKENILHDNIRYILEKINQYILYLCIKPEWEAKFEPVFQSSIYKIEIYNFHKRLIKFFTRKVLLKSYTKYGNHLYSYINNKYIDIDYYINKISSLNYVNAKIKIWLNYQYFSEESNNIIPEINVVSFNYQNNLYRILQKILYTGIEWYNLNCIQRDSRSFYIFRYQRVFYLENNWININYTYNLSNNNFLNIFTIILEALGLNTNKLKFLSICSNKYNLYFFNYCIQTNQYQNILSSHNTKIIVKVTETTFRYFLKNIKIILYHKNFNNKWRPNTSLTLNKYLRNINLKFNLWCNYYYLVLSINTIKEYYEMLDNFLYNWLKKTYKTSQLKLLKNNKKLIHKQINK